MLQVPFSFGGGLSANPDRLSWFPGKSY